MNIMDMLKKAFPKPIIPQKRYLILFGLIIYFAAKTYVVNTPNPADDQIPDQMKAILLDIFANDEDSDSSEYDENGMRVFGETS